jgi:3-oxoacyl-[acyl-carrier protein] reductase
MPAYFVCVCLLVRLAGFASDRMFHSTSDESFDLIMNVHVRAPFRLIREAAPYFRIKVRHLQSIYHHHFPIHPFMYVHGKTYIFLLLIFVLSLFARLTCAQDPSIPRSIINVSSTSGLHGSAGQANYATAKSALLGLTKTLAKEWGPAYGVRCNTVAFGIVDTRLVSPMENGQVIQLDAAAATTAATHGSDRRNNRKHMARIGIPRLAREETIKATVLKRPGTPEEAAAAILL